MFAMFNAIFQAITTMANATNRGANAVDHLARAAECRAKKYADEICNEVDP